MQVNEKTISLNTQVVYVCRNYKPTHSKCCPLNKVHAYLMVNHNGPNELFYVQRMHTKQKNTKREIDRDGDRSNKK